MTHLGPVWIYMNSMIFHENWVQNTLENQWFHGKEKNLIFYFFPHVLHGNPSHHLNKILVAPPSMKWSLILFLLPYHPHRSLNPLFFLFSNHSFSPCKPLLQITSLVDQCFPWLPLLLHRSLPTLDQVLCLLQSLKDDISNSPLHQGACFPCHCLSLVAPTLSLPLISASYLTVTTITS